MTTIFSKLIEGGAIYMFPILFLFLLIVALIVQGSIKKQKHKKNIQLISHLGNFALAWGVFGMTLGLIQVFDLIQQWGGVSQTALSGGLKVALLNPAFGLIVFLTARLGIIVMLWKQTEIES